MTRFFKRIEEKATDVSQPPVLVVAFGDSITQGQMEHGRFAPDAVYHRVFQQYLQEQFPLTTFSIINAGVSGGTATQALDRLGRDVVSHHPDLVIVGFGANDCLGGAQGLDAFATALEKIIRTVREQTLADLVLMTPPFMANRQNDRIHAVHADIADQIINAQVNGNLADYVQRIRQLAAEMDVPMADVNKAWDDRFIDGDDTTSHLCNGLNHPDECGQRLLADVVRDCVFAKRNLNLLSLP